MSGWFRQPNTEDERRFQAENKFLAQSRLEASDVCAKYATDAGYRAKVDLIRNVIHGTQGWVLDMGSGTCGEAEHLATTGFRMLATDINPALFTTPERG